MQLEPRRNCNAGPAASPVLAGIAARLRGNAFAPRACMLATIESATVVGVDASRVRVEIDVSKGFPHFQLVGLPDASIKESRDRVRAAMAARGLTHLVLYADREHFANVAWLTNFDPRFEEALLILSHDNTPLLDRKSTRLNSSHT